MKKINSAIVTALILLTSTFSVTSYAAPNSKADVSKNQNNKDEAVIATYNNNNHNIKVNKSDIEKLIGGKKFDDLKRDAQEYVIKQYIINKLLTQAIQDAKMVDSSEIKQKMDNIKHQLLIEELLKSKVKSSVTEEAIDDAYNKFAKEFANKNQAKISHILVSSKDKANEIKEKLNKGIKFDTLAQESLDKNTKDKGGVIDQYIIEGTVFPEFDKKVFSMKVGEISDPIQIPSGEWEIIKLNEKKQFTVPKKEDIKPSLIEKLNDEATEKYISSLYKSADVKINTDKLNSNSTDQDNNQPQKK